jgi:hypothetical protein
MLMVSALKRDFATRTNQPRVISHRKKLHFASMLNFRVMTSDRKLK